MNQDLMVFIQEQYNNLPKTLNLVEYKSTGTHWVVLFVKSNDITYFVEPITKEIKKFNGNKDIKTIVFRIQAYESIMFGFFCILGTDCMLNSKTLNDFTILFSPSDFKKNDKIILNYYK